MVGKNLDWPIGDGFIVINPRGISKTALTISGKKPARWISKYGSITFNQFGNGFPLCGMNEAGLVVEELSFSPSVYPEVDTLCFVNELQWIQYQLDNYQSTGEVVRSLGSPAIARLMFGLHYLVCDRAGNTAVIEFIDGEIHVYTGKLLEVAVLTNNRYDNSLRYLHHHAGFGGERVVGNGPESPERFVRAASLLREFPTIRDNSPLQFAQKILQSVRQHDTRWSIIYDPLSATIRYRTRLSREFIILHLDSLISAAKKPLYRNLPEEGGGSVYEQPEFRPYDAAEAEPLIRRIFSKMLQTGDFDNLRLKNIRGKILDFNKIEVWEGQQ
ncbi:MAG: hypothetical protein Kow0042_30980 [Calditrichia bacterium]